MEVLSNGAQRFVLNHGVSVLEVDITAGIAHLEIQKTPLSFTKSLDPTRDVTYTESGVPTIVEFRHIDDEVRLDGRVLMRRSLVRQLRNVFEGLGYSVRTNFPRYSY
ncbi:hypothetical protein HY025_01645 [Candidatus Daviesbacteria bacterium]|nr:hypothetical protein [Candidatus Daviesbacteria bacterium]